MDFKIVCSAWIKEDDEKILNVLRSSDKWLSAGELSDRTGLPPHRVKRTLDHLKQQMALYESRKKLLDEEQIALAQTPKERTQ